MKKQSTYILIIVVAALLLTAGLSLLNKNGANGSHEYDALASCLTEKGAKFYGAFWCPHCQEQKKVFGASQKLLPYIECSTANAAGQLPVCIEAKVESYPTWEFADGSRITGGLTPMQLAEKTDCPLPPSEASESINTSTSSATK